MPADVLSSPSSRYLRRTRGAMFNPSLIVLVAVGVLCGVGCGTTQKPPVLPPKYATLPPKIVPDYLKGSLFERVDLHNTDPLNVNNFGFVVNLPNATGDSTVKLSVKDYVVKQMVKSGIGSARMPGLPQPEEMLRDPRNAIVRVDALIPAGARVNQRVDVQVSAMPGSNTSSLAGGELWSTELMVRGFDTDYPGVAIDIMAIAEKGAIFVNPEYALWDPNDATARASLRYGVVLGGARVKQDRPLWLRVRAPEWRTTKEIETRINNYFQDGTVARAVDDGIVQIYTPLSMKGDWEHFAGVATHLYFNNSAEFAAVRARQLAEEAVKPDAALLDISYCWEGLGAASLPIIVPLMSHSSPDVSFAATRAAAFLGESSALSVLATIAQTNDHPFQVSAVQVLGSLPRSPAISQVLRSLLESTSNIARIEAYRHLAEAGDASIYSKPINNGRFILDIVPSRGQPLIYAWRRGASRIAVFGNKPSLDFPVAFAALQNRLTITGNDGERTVKIFYRDPAVQRPQAIISNPDIAEIIARLGGEGADDSPQRLNFSYGEVVAIVQAMTAQREVMAMAADGQRMPTPFMLQPAPRVQDEIESAPPIPELGRPQGNEPPVPSTQPATEQPVQTEARM